ncbi:BamA/TamA family outer membrane protein [Balneola sp. MJW-20]|uniref:BamA/TamA family outer membrane protein n=1 Tax=Gracilimonas aurantiaca TaxID=3234185 RepID=UPI003466E7C9
MRLLTGIILLFLLLPVEEVYSQSVRYLIEDGEQKDVPDAWQNDQALITQWYAAKGYLSARVTFSEDSLFVEKGCRYSLNMENRSENDEWSAISKPEWYAENNIESFFGNIITRLKDQGFLFATTTVDSILIDDDHCTVDLFWSVNKSDQVWVKSFRVNGLNDEENNYLNKRSRLRDSTVVNRYVLNSLRNDLIRTEWFLRVSAPSVFKVEDRYLILVEAEKHPSADFEGLIGYVPSPEGEGQIVGDIDLNIRNAFTLGNRIGFNFQRIRPETSELDISLSQDWISDIPISLTSNFYFYQNDTTYQARNLRLGAAYEIYPGFHLTGDIDLQNTTAGDEDQLLNEPDGSKQTALLGFRISTLDNTEVPTRGSLIELSFGRAFKDIENDSLGTIRQSVLKSTLRKFIPVNARNILALSAYGFILDADNYTLHDLIRFGGANSLRGYSEQQFRASLMLWSDLEYRYLTDPYSYLFLFGSFGGYNRPKLINENDNSFVQKDYLYSFGFGLSYRTAIGRIKFSYAISPQDAISNGKIHIGIRTAL